MSLPVATTLYRVFSYPGIADPYPSWEVGSWWSPTPIPQSDAAWRGEFAVEVSWNGGQYAIAWTTPQVVYAWQGPTALQPGEYVTGAPAPGYYLPGGAIQVYIAPPLLPIGTWLAGPSPWHSSSEALAADTSRTAPVPEQSYGGLAQRLGQLSEVLTTMAKEGERKGVYVAHLRFQAARIAQAHAYLQQFKPRHNILSTSSDLS